MVEKDSTAISPDYEIVDDATVFPICSFLPKCETQCLSFIKKHKSFDGRNTLIAILDTGVDPAAPGLQVTSTGDSKIVDIIDCSGAGDVDTSTVRLPDSDGYIIGLTGRRLKIPTEWSNPSHKYHVGIKNLYELYPTNLKERIMKERRENLWDSMHRLTVADVTRQMDILDKKLDESPKDLVDKWTKENATALSDLIGDIDDRYVDCGPVLDCIVFHDGQMWKACMDTSFTGNLSKCKVLGSYRDTKDYAQFTCKDLLTYSVNFYENGDLLQIVATSGLHGTHVASIAAAYFPDNEERNGLAPGAQILSLCIGDSRLNAMETGTALTRAINLCIEAKVDIINYSYGEDSHFPEYGPICKAIEDAVYKHNIIFVSSASNNGPALSSVACPGGSLNACISVGAYVSTEMMKELYCIRDKLPLTVFSWSSRGPAPDGGIGVDISAPGAAFASVPNWTLKGSSLHHGTSMSSPNAAGCIACLLSALKHENVLYSPLSIKRALQNTATKLEDFEVLSIGQGLLQIDDAFEFMMANYRHLDSEVRYEITCSGARGIYLRESHQLEINSEMSIDVKPIFKENMNCTEKVNFERHFKLQCNESWVECPNRLTIANYQKSFSIKIDLKLLKENSLNFSQILAYDNDHPDVGPLWRFPVTVIVPEKVSIANRYTVKAGKIFFRPSLAYRHFINVPDGAEWASMKFHCSGVERQNQFAFHAMQLYPHKSHSSTESFKMTILPKDGEAVVHFPVLSNRTLELCLAKWWSNVGDVYGDFELNFRGLTPLCPSLTVLSSDGIQRTYFQSKLLFEEAEPSVSLKFLCKPIKPSKSKIGVLGTRDLFQEGNQVYRLICDYDFSISQECSVTPTFPSICHYLYENQYSCYFWMIFSKTNEYICSGGAFPTRYSRKLEKGDYLLSLQLRHEDKSFLEKAKNTTLIMKYHLKSCLSIDCYSTWACSVKKSKKFGSQVIPTGQTVPLYFGSIPSDKLPKNSAVGCYLEGNFTLAKYEPAKRASKFEFRYVIDDDNSKQSTQQNAKNDDGDEKTSMNKYKAALRDLQMTWMSRLDKEQAELTYESLKQDHDDYLPLYLARIKALTDQGYLTNRQEILKIADGIINKIDQKSILEYFGIKDDITAEAEKVKKEITKKRSILIDALIIKGSAIAELLLERDADSFPPTLLKWTNSKRVDDDNNKRDVEAVLEQSDNERDDRDGSSFQGPNCDVGQAFTKRDVEPKPSPSTLSVDCNDNVAGTIVNGFTSVSITENISDAETSPLRDPENSFSVDICSPNQIKNSEKFTVDDLDKIFVDLVKFCDIHDSKAYMFGVKHAVVHQHYGRAFKYLKIGLTEKSSKELDTIAIELYEKLGWMHVADHQRNWLLVKYPPSRRLF